MKLYPLRFALIVLAILSTHVARGEGHFLYSQTRQTYDGVYVTVKRQDYNTPKMVAANIKLDKDIRDAYPDAKPVVAGFLFHYARNCHDYAWGPWMSLSSPFPPLNSEPENSWMDDPTMNWNDASVSGVGVSSMTMTVQCLAEIPDATGGGWQYVFDPGQLNILPVFNYDVFGQYVPLPVCPLVGPGQVPAHSAILIGWDTVPNDVQLSPGVAGLYKSKWGDGGIYIHRYGYGHVPDGYLSYAVPQGTPPPPPLPIGIFTPSAPGWVAPYYIPYTDDY